MRVIGVAMGYIPDVTLVTNDTNIEAGIVEAGGNVKVLTAAGLAQMQPTAIITYKREPARTRQGADTHITSYANLKLFSEVAVKYIYARGMEP